MVSLEKGRAACRQLTGNLQTQGSSTLGLGVWLVFELVLLFELGSSLNHKEVIRRNKVSKEASYSDKDLVGREKGDRDKIERTVQLKPESQN